VKKTFAVSLLAGTLLLAASAADAKKSQVIEDMDFGTYSCANFLQEASTATSEDLGAVFMWLDGYLSGVSGDTVLKWKGLEEFGQKLVKYCSDHRKVKLLDAAKKVGID
jgi:acid stress chaperone HdeB